MTGFIEQFGTTTDPRVDGTKKHKLIDILFITLAAILCGCDEWAGLKSIIEITGERTDKKTGLYQKETHYYISDLQQDAESFNHLVRKHWSIENSPHRVLDVAFKEDTSRKRAKNAAENFAILNRMALNIVKADNSTKASMKRKWKMAGWDDQYLEHLLLNIKN